MKIFIIGSVSSSIFGFRYGLLKELVCRGHEVVFYVSDWTDAMAVSAKDELQVEVRSYPLSRSGMNPLSDLRTLWFLYREFQRDKPDRVFSFFSKPVIWGSLAAWMAGVPWRVGMLEGLGYAFTDQPNSKIALKQKLIRKIQIFLYKLAIPRLHEMVFLNPDDPIDLLDTHHFSAKQVRVLGGIGVDLEKFSPMPPPLVSKLAGVESGHSLVFLFIGRLLAEKGINEFIKAASLVRQRYPTSRFVVLGGLDRDSLGSLTEQQLDFLIAQRIIEYPGFVTDVADWLAKANVFVLPSYYREGVPASTQEAMAVGRAIITTDVPGCRETLVDGVNGFLVPPWSPDMLAEKMIWMIEHPERVIEMGKESRRLAEERFDAVKKNQKLIEWMRA